MSGGVSVVVVLDVLCIGSAEGSRLDSMLGIPVIGVDVSGTDTGDFKYTAANTNEMSKI